jgi:hypothetical protein
VTKAAPTEAERLRTENQQLRQQVETLEQRIQIKEWLARAETRAEKNKVRTMVLQLVQREQRRWGWSARHAIRALALPRASVLRWAWRV